MAVVTTAALAAGVDFPASQVIFASLTMGIKWLTVAEFEQMAGRAGRYKKHDSGKVYLLITPGRMYTGAQNDTEEHIAMHLLKGQIEPLNLPSEESAHFTEILAVIAMYSSSNEEERGITLKDLQFYHSLLYNNAFYFNIAINTLVQQGFIKLIRNQSEAITTRFGRAVGETFLRTDKALQIKEALTVPVSEEKSAPDLLKLAQEMDPFKNVYVTNRGLSEMSSKNQAKPTSNNLFSNAILSLMTADSLAKKGHMSDRFYEILLKWSDEIFNCTCQDKPYCECAREHIQEILLESRFQGMSLDEILLYLADIYEIQIFHGDLTDWFEQLIYSLQAIYKIGQTLKVPPQTMLRIQNIPNVIDQLIHAKKPENIEDEEDN
jgi:helicase